MTPTETNPSRPTVCFKFRHNQSTNYAYTGKVPKSFWMVMC